MSKLSLQEAVFISALPYRQSLFLQGGWKQSKGPGSNDWENFLTKNFLASEINTARQLSKKYEAKLELSLNGITLPLQYTSLWENSYPYCLMAIYDPPPVLFFWGFSGIPSKGYSWNKYATYLAIVGTRAASHFCQKAIELFIQQFLRNYGQSSSQNASALCIVSGLALGIDRMAHQAAINQKLPNLAVLGSGIAQAGPRYNLDLLRQAHKQDLPFILISEFAPHAYANRISFPRRNRIIAGLSENIAIMQAPKKSGAIITARYALEEGREVMVFDHPAFDAQRGANDGGRALLQNGATAIHLPELSQYIIEAEPQQLALWRKQLYGAKRLGGNYYLWDSP